MDTSTTREYDVAMTGKAVVGIAGMPGSGKATIKEFAQEMGYSMVVMGDEIREEAKRRKLKPTPENLGQLMLKLREEEGPAVVARRCVPKTESAEEKVVIVDGIRKCRTKDDDRFFGIAGRKRSAWTASIQAISVPACVHNQKFKTDRKRVRPVHNRNKRLLQAGFESQRG